MLVFLYHELVVQHRRKAMKKASGSVRIDLAQYREMEVFTQFSSDLDDATKAQLAVWRLSDGTSETATVQSA